MKEKYKIKHIIFDLSEVLLTGIKDTGIALGEKHKIDNDTIKNTVNWTYIKTPLLVPLVEELFHGNVTEDNYIEAVLNEYPQLGTKKWLKEHIRANFKEVTGTREVIKELKKLGYTTALLSVHAKEWINYCEKIFDFHKLFDVKGYSFNDKVSKPDPLSFQKILERLSAIPEECIFIDDSEININSARSLGIYPILFTNAENLRTELSQVLHDSII